MIVAYGAVTLTMQVGGLSSDIVVAYRTILAETVVALVRVMVAYVAVFAPTIGAFSFTRTGVLGRWAWEVVAVVAGFSLGIVVELVVEWVGVVLLTIVGPGCLSSSFAWQMEER